MTASGVMLNSRRSSTNAIFTLLDFDPRTWTSLTYLKDGAKRLTHLWLIDPLRILKDVYLIDMVRIWTDSRFQY